VTLHADPAPRERRYSDVVQVFEPNTLALPPIDDYLAELAERGELIDELARAEVRGQRSSSFLGELWTLVDPVFQASIYMFLFLVIRGSSGRSAEFVTAIVGSVFFFNYTRIAISDGGRAIVRNKGLVLNAVFPRALLPIAEVYKGLLSTLPALALYVVIHTVARAPVTAAVLMIPLLLVIQTGLNLGFAFLLSTATVFFKDVSNLMSYVLRVLMFATPVIYPVSMLTPTIRAVLSWNPYFALFTAYQAVITGHTPSAGLIFQSIGWAVLVFGTGAWVFLRHERSFGLHL
jgi:teichoic acid transport system permease protein